MDQLTPHQQATRFLAELLLELAPGDRLPIVQEINSQLGVGAGTVQKAMSLLREAGVVSVSARGHMGTFVEQLDHGRLWTLAGRGPMRLLLPFVDAPEFRGLSEGIDRALGQRGVPVRIAHQRGAARRMAGVRTGAHDACVVSELAFARGGAGLEGIPFGPVNYYRAGSVTVLTGARAAKKHLRIAYDPMSLDHCLLTDAEFPPDAARHTRVPCPYAHLLSAILAGAVDCGIWHRVEVGVALDVLPVSARPPREAATLSLLRQCEQAYLVFRSGRPDLSNLLRLIDPTPVREAQEEAEADSAAEAAQLQSLVSSA